MKKFYFLLLTILLALTGWSKTTKWTGGAGGNRNWDVLANWDNGIPADGDIVIISTNTDITIMRVAANDANNVLILNSLSILGNSVIRFRTIGSGKTIAIAEGVAGNDFIIEAGSQLFIENGLNMILSPTAEAGIFGQLNVNDDRTYFSSGVTEVANTGIINNAGIVASPTIFNLLFQSGATYIHAGNGGSIPTAAWSTSSNTIISGITNDPPNGLGQTFGNFEWSASQSADIDLEGNLMNIAGDLTISKTSGQPAIRELYFTRIPNYILNVGGDLIIKKPAVGNTNVHFVSDGDGDAVINVAGDYKHQSGNLVFVKVTDNFFDGTARLNLAGDLIQSGGDIDFTSGDQNSGAGQKGRMFIKGNFAQSAGTMRSTTEDDDILNGLITFNKVGVQTFNAASPANVSYINIVIASGSTLKLASGLRISRDNEPNWIGKLTVSAGATFDASTFVVSSQLDPDAPAAGAVAQFNLLPGAKLITANATGVQGSINTANNLTASLSSAADYEFQGASTGVFVTTTPNTIHDFIINRASGNVTMAMPIRVSGTLLLSKGLLTTTPTNFPTITAAGSASEATSISFVNGRIAKEGTTAFTFPVGKSGAGFRNIGITTPSGSATFRAEFFRAVPPTGTLETSLTRVSSCEYWDLTKTAGTGVSANVVLSWEANSNCGGGAYVTNPVTLRVAHLLGGTWINEGRSASTGDNTAGTVTSSDAPTTFSPFALASISVIDNPLPVVFANVKAYEKNSGVQIEWSNLTEKDVASYTIERSENGIDFSSIGQQSPTSNQNDKADYNAFDANPYTGVNYYRIKAEETTGKIVYSKVLSVNLGKSNVGLRLYPNPVTGNQVTISLSNVKRGQYSLRVINNAGQVVFKQTITSLSSMMTQTLDLPLSVKPGVYNMVITGNDYRENKMFIVQ